MTRRKRRPVAVAGSSTFPLTPALGAAVLDLLAAYPQGTVFWSRGSAGFDEFVVMACGVMGLPVEVVKSGGGADNWLRDAEMSRECAELLAFLDPRTLHDENTGTSHLVSKFMDQKRRTRAYTAAGDRLVYVGDTE